MRGRSVGDAVLAGTVDIPAPPARLIADWQREIGTRLELEPGDVAPLPLARARMRWPDYRLCVQSVSGWLHAQGLHGLPGACDVALMACRGARYHHDGAQYGGAAFCNLFLSEDKGLDLHFPFAGHRIPLARGTVVVFDTGQPHGVIPRHGRGFDAADFAPDQDRIQVFLTWELPIAHPGIRQALQVRELADSGDAQLPHEDQVLLNGAAAQLCPDTGRWCPEPRRP